MADITFSRTVDCDYEETVERVRKALAEVGFGVLTEIDLAATLSAKLGVEVAPKLILGACRPQLAHAALQIDARVATLLPCNVVVSAADPGTQVEVMNPALMPELTGRVELDGVAAEAAELLRRMLDNLERTDE